MRNLKNHGWWQKRSESFFRVFWLAKFCITAPVKSCITPLGNHLYICITMHRTGDLERLSKKLSLLRQSNWLSELQGYIHTIQQWLQKSRWGLAWLHWWKSTFLYPNLLQFVELWLHSIIRHMRYWSHVLSFSFKVWWNCRGGWGGHVVTINTILTQFWICISTDINPWMKLYGPYIKSRFCHWSITICTNKVGQYLTEKPCIQLVQVISCQ